jgi:hypothetical protein
MDSLKDYLYYYPKYNASSVIRALNQLQKKLL